MRTSGKCLALGNLLFGAAYISGVIPTPGHSARMSLLFGIIGFGGFIATIANEVIFAIQNSQQKQPVSTKGSAGAI